MGNLCICFKKSAKISTKSKSDEIIFSQIAMPDWKQQIDEEIKVQHFDEFQVGEEEFNQKIEMKNNKVSEK